MQTLVSRETVSKGIVQGNGHRRGEPGRKATMTKAGASFRAWLWSQRTLRMSVDVPDLPQTCASDSSVWVTFSRQD